MDFMSGTETMQQVSYLTVGSSKTVSVLAKRKWNRSGIQLQKSGRYVCTAPNTETWRDLDINCDANGWPRDKYKWRFKLFKWAEKLRRSSEANWFQLVGTYGESLDELIVIGTQHTFEASHDAELCLFANDLPFMYWNNSGSLFVEIRRIQ